MFLRLHWWLLKGILQPTVIIRIKKYEEYGAVKGIINEGRVLKCFGHTEILGVDRQL